jgi:hypothetical protein
MENPFQIIIDYLREIKRNVGLLITLIKDISRIASSIDNEEVLDFEGFCRFLKLSKATGYKYTSQNLVPFIKKEGKLLFLKSELLEWLKTGRVKTKWELDEEAEKYVSSKINIK